MVILSIVACIIQQSGFAGLVTHFDRLREMIRQSGAFGYTLYILLFIVATLFLLPGTLLVIAGGVIFGPLAGTLLSLLAATLASSASFLFARWLGRELLLKYVGQTAIFQAIEKGIARSGTDFLILTRLIPLFPYNVQNYAYGLTAIPFWTFTFISALTHLARHIYLYADGQRAYPRGYHPPVYTEADPRGAGFICPDSDGEKICPLSANRDITDTGSR